MHSSEDENRLTTGWTESPFLLVDPPSNSTLSPPEDGIEPPRFDEVSIIKTIILSLMFVVSLTGNTLTLVQIGCRNRRSCPRRSTIHQLIVHLSIADLIVTFFCNVTDAVWASTVQWYGGTWTCKLIKYVQLFGLYLSTYIIVVIGLDRCFAIMDPLGRSHSKVRVRTMTIAAYVLSAIFSLPQLFIFRVVRGPFVEDFHQCVTHGSYTSAWQEQLYSFLSVLLMYVLPLVAMVTSYTLIFCTVARKTHDLQSEAEEEMICQGHVRMRFFRKAKVKSLRLTALIVAAFIICWTPYQVIFIAHTFIDSSDIDTRYVVWIFFFGMANSMVNPMIYGAFHLCKYRKSRRSATNKVVLRTVNRYNTGCSANPSPSPIARNGASSLTRPAAGPTVGGTTTATAASNRSQTQKYHLEVHIHPKDMYDWSP